MAIQNQYEIVVLTYKYLFCVIILFSFICDSHKLIVLFLTTVDPEDKALTDGRIGPEIVGIDRNSLFDSMNVKEGIEVRD